MQSTHSAKQRALGTADAGPSKSHSLRLVLARAEHDESTLGGEFHPRVPVLRGCSRAEITMKLKRKELVRIPEEELASQRENPRQLHVA
jgi:hypothetical protein